jgi:acyl carrier protein
MDRGHIQHKVKEIIASVANLDPVAIGDEATFIEDLGLDSLSLLEIGVDVDYAFKLGVPEERLQDLRTVADTVALVEECLAGRPETQTAAVA